MRSTAKKSRKQATASALPRPGLVLLEHAAVSSEAYAGLFMRASPTGLGASGDHCQGRTSPGTTATMPTTTQFVRQDATDQIFAIKTWRYLRASMIGFVLAIFIGVRFERSKAPGCFQTSISAYYYTPVHGIFIGALVAVGTCLICLQRQHRCRRHPPEPRRHVRSRRRSVPTPGTGSCGSVLTTADNRDVNISNNMFVLLAVGAAGFRIPGGHRHRGRVKHGNWPPRLCLIGYALTLACGDAAVVTLRLVPHVLPGHSALTQPRSPCSCASWRVVILDAVSYKVHKRTGRRGASRSGQGEGNVLVLAESLRGYRG